MKKRLILCSFIAVLLASAVLGWASFAWLPGADITDPEVKSSVLTNYFESGDGTKEYPYIIHTPRHLYNLAWLQYLGYFNDQKNEDGTAKQFYFKLCDGLWTDKKTGKQTTCGGIKDESGTVTNNLDMTGWVLPPIGNKVYPFIGNFTGAIGTTGGKVKISNLTVSGSLSELTNPALTAEEFKTYGAYISGNNGCDIIGLFGCIGTVGTDGSVVEPGTIIIEGNTVNYSTAENAVADFSIENITVKSGTASTLAGIVAGYANGISSEDKTTSTISGVEVVSTTTSTVSTVNTIDTTGTAAMTAGFTTNVSDYTTIGFCNAALKGSLDATTTNIGEPTSETSSSSSSSGSGNAWGGSLNIYKTHTRIASLIGSASTTKQIWRITGATKNLDGKVTGGTEEKANFYYIADDGQEGAYTLAEGSNELPIGSFQYLSGGAHVLNSTVYEAVNRDAYLISDGTHYLNFDTSSKTIVVGTDASKATMWVFENDTTTGKTGKVYTIYEQTQYFLNRDGSTTSLVAGTDSSAASSWVLMLAETQNANGQTAGSMQTGGLFLEYNGTKWQLAGNTYIVYEVKTGSETVTHYLGISSAAVTEKNTAWFFEEDTTSGSETAKWLISGYEGSTRYYLSTGSISQDMEALTLTTSKDSATRWIVGDDISIAAPDGAPSDYEIAYIDGAWYLAYRNYHKIKETGTSGKYLGISWSGSTGTFTNADNTRWILETDTNGTKISTVHNHTKYYLYCNGYSLSLNGSGTSTLWTVTKNTSITYTVNNILLTLQYVDQWCLVRCCTITDSDGNILGADTENKVLDAATSTKWLILSPGQMTTGTYICTLIGSTYYYLYNNGGTPTISTTGKTVWKIDASGNIQGENLNLYYDSAWKLGTIYPSNCYIVRDYNNEFYINYASYKSGQTPTSKFTSRYGATVFECSGFNSSSFELKVYGASFYVGREQAWWSLDDHYNLELKDKSVKWTHSKNTTTNYDQVTFIEGSTTYYIYYADWLSNAWLARWAIADRDQIHIIPVYPTFTLTDATKPATDVIVADGVTSTSGVQKTLSSLLLTKTRIRDYVTKTGQEFWDYNRDNVTYIPLTTDDNYKADSDNTGYILGGSNNLEESTLAEFPAKSGDIRISWHRYTGIADDYINWKIWPWETRHIEKALTIGKDGQDYVGSDTYPSDRFQKYASTDGTGKTVGAKADFDEMLQDDESEYADNAHIYGIHFMSAALNKNNLVYLKKATIEKTVHSDYQMPASSIDFQLQTRGFITFFAGTYFDDNNAFFSLHRVLREKDNYGTKATANLIIYEKKNAASTGPARIYKCNDGEFYTDNFVAVTLPTDFEISYTQINTNAYMEQGNTTKALKYKDSSGAYFTYDKGTRTAATLEVDDVDVYAITDVKEIAKIFAVYKDDSTTIDADYAYIYRYTDGSYSVKPTQATDDWVQYDGRDYYVAFNTQWLTNPTIPSSGNSWTAGLFYFEIPVNAGEYALGSVSGKTGAYLLYLDISANAQYVRTQTVTEVRDTTISTYNYPLGVQLRDVGTTTVFDAKNSSAFSFSTGDKVRVSRSDDSLGNQIVSVKTEALTVAASYIGNEVTLKCNGTEITTMAVVKKTFFETEKVIYNQNQGTNLTISTEQKVTLTERKVDADGKTLSSTVTITENGTTYEGTDDGLPFATPTKYLLKTHTNLYEPLVEETTPLDIDTDYVYTLVQTSGEINHYDIAAIFTTDVSGVTAKIDATAESTDLITLTIYKTPDDQSIVTPYDSFAAAPAEISLVQGESQRCKIVLAAGTVTATSTGTGVTATVSDDNVTITAASSAALGSYTVTLTDAGRTTDNTTTVTVTVTKASTTN